MTRQLEENFTSEGMTRHILWTGEHSMLVAVTQKKENVVAGYEVWAKKILPETTTPAGTTVPERVKKMKSKDFGRHAWSIGVNNKFSIMAMVENLENGLNPYGYNWSDNVSIQTKIENLAATTIDGLDKLERWLASLLDARGLSEPVVVANETTKHAGESEEVVEPEENVHETTKLQKTPTELQVEEYLKNPPFDFSIKRRQDDLQSAFYGGGDEEE